MQQLLTNREEVARWLPESPNSWRVIRAKFLMHEIDLPSATGTERLLSLSKGRGVVPKADLKRQGSAAASLVGYKHASRGQIVMNKMQAWNGMFGLSAHDGIVSPEYTVLGVHRETADPRFLNYLLRSTLMIAQFAWRSRGMGTAFLRLHPENLLDTPMVCPPLDEQRAIADFLDRETARIDTLIAQKARLATLMEERLTSARDGWLDRLLTRNGSKRLRRVVQRIEQGWSPQCDNQAADDSEWGVLKTSAVSTGVFRPMENKRLPAEIEPDVRWVVRDGDLIVTRGSGSPKHVGMAAVARTEGRRLMMSDLTYRILLTGASAGFVSEVMQSSACRRHIRSSVRTDVGQTLKIRAEDLKDVVIPDVEYERQLAIVEGFQGTLRPIQAAIGSLLRQGTLLKEHRQALITAAVTGQLEIPAAA